VQAVASEVSLATFVLFYLMTVFALSWGTTRGANRAKAAIASHASRLKRVVFRFARRGQANERQDGCRGEVVTDVLQAVVLGKPRGDVRRE